MFETMYDAPGIGLAAPQVGVLKRLLVMDCVKEEGAAPRPMALFDPVVNGASEDRSTYEEGCLSIPEQYADVERPADVEVSWTDLDGARRRERFDGALGDLRAARDRPPGGQLFIDYLKPMRRQMITRKMQKLKREKARA